MRNGLVGAVAAMGCLLVLCSPAWAGGARSFVSGDGSDVGTCEHAAPCRTFGYAITQTTAGGEVVAVDSSGYGPVTINKSIALVAPRGVHAGLSPSAGNAITVNVGSSGDVTLRNLVLRSNGATNGVVITSGNVKIEDCDISRFQTGVVVGASSPIFLDVLDSRLVDNGDGILANASGTILRRLAVDGSQFVGSGLEGINLGDDVVGDVSNSRFDDNGIGFAINPIQAALTTTFVTVDTTEFDSNVTGIEANDAVNAASVSQVNIGRSSIVHNNTGVSGNVFTYADNTVENNTAGSTFAGTVARH